MERTFSEKLELLSQDLTWNQFEALPLAHIAVMDNDRHDSQAGEGCDPFHYDFYMRLGLYMGRPTQAIFSCGKFVRFRKPLLDFSAYPLVKIDPHDPQGSLYRNPYSQYNNFGTNHTPLSPCEHWNPMSVHNLHQPNPLLGGPQYVYQNIYPITQTPYTGITTTTGGSIGSLSSPTYLTQATQNTSMQATQLSSGSLGSVPFVGAK
jgi:hypothetical protein